MPRNNSSALGRAITGKSTASRKNFTAAERMKLLNVDPLGFLAFVLRDEGFPVDTRVMIAKTLLPYQHYMAQPEKGATNANPPSLRVVKKDDANDSGLGK